MAMALLWRCFVLGESFSPLRQLAYVAPWSAYTDPSARPAWNPLHYDSVGQYRVFRSYATDSLRRGRLPLWNPYQLCGTPFVANNLSAVYYPANVLHAAMGPDRAAGWFAALHLLLAALFMWAFLLKTGASDAAATIGGAIYGFATWQIVWLHLPPFVSTACWLPALSLILLHLRERPSGRTAGLLGIAVALVLLAGHLQVAFYVLGTAAVVWFWLLLRQRPNRVPFTIAAVSGLAIGMLLSAPQTLPTAELMLHAHRGGGPTLSGYAAYTAYASHPSALATLLLPDFFGNPSLPDRPYVGFSRGGMYYNYAEGAMYVGVLPLFLLAAGIVSVRRRSDARFASGLAAVALLVALGTPVAALLYFGIPGFSGSGSPGRILVLWTFAAAWLASIGYDAIFDGTIARRSSWWIIAVVIVLSAAAIVSAVASSIRVLGGVPLSLQEAGRQLGLVCLAALCSGEILCNPNRRKVAFVAVAAVVGVDLLAHGVPYNGTARTSELSSADDTVRAIVPIAGHDRVAPVNTSWSFGGPSAALPPNMATLFSLRDVQGYDSLLPGQYKAWLRDRLGVDPSPPEVGNMIFLKRPDAGVLDAMGVRVVLSVSPLDLPDAVANQRDGTWVYTRRHWSERARAVTDDGRSVGVQYLTDEPARVRLTVTMPSPGRLELADQFWPGWHAWDSRGPLTIQKSNGIFRSVPVVAGSQTIEFRYEPASTRVGLLLLCLGACLTAACMTARCTSGRVSGGE